MSTRKYHRWTIFISQSELIEANHATERDRGGDRRCGAPVPRVALGALRSSIHPKSIVASSYQLIIVKRSCLLLPLLPWAIPDCSSVFLCIFRRVRGGTYGMHTTNRIADACSARQAAKISVDNILGQLSRACFKPIFR
jgi:hypothetical protein